MTFPKVPQQLIIMADKEKKPISWWLELARAILAAIAGLLGSQATGLI